MSAADATTAPAVATEPVGTATTTPAIDNTIPVAAGTEDPSVASGAAPTETAAAVAPVEPVKEKVGKDEVKIEATPVTEGTLAYKAPGLLKFFNKKHFWLGDESVSHESLSRYLKEEKDTKIGHHNVAHASETGKGLLFFAKRAEDKTAPEGIINLADATDVTREPGDRFSFKVHGKKHEFHAANRVETEGWTVAVESAVQEAVASKDTVAGGENYKSTHSKLGGAAVAGVAGGAAAGAATGAVADKEAIHDGTTATETTATADKKEARSSSKGRSSSRKRASIFGGLIGKKDEKSIERANEKEAKKETKEEEKHEKEAEKEAKKEDKALEKAAEKQEEAATHANRKAEEIAAAAVAAPVIGEEANAAETSGAPTAITEGTPVTTGEAATAPTTKQSKRSSVFGFFNKKSGDIPLAKDTKEVTPPAVPAKDTAAPQLDPVDTSVPTETVATETPAVAAESTPVTTAAVAEPASAESSSNPLTAVENTPEAKAANKQKEGGDLFSFMKKKKAEVDEKKAVDSTEGVAAAEKTEGTATSPTEKRRSSFFNSLGGAKKERGTSPEGEKKSGLGGLFRKSSKSQKPTTGPVTDSSAPPAIPDTVEGGAAATTEAPVAASTEAAPVAESVAKADVPAVAGTTTGTDNLPVTTGVTEATPATTTATTTA